MASENDFMLGIASAVADGSPIDWAAAETRTNSEQDRRLLRSLRLVSEIGTVHDSVDDEVPTAEASSGDASGPHSFLNDPLPSLPTDLQQWGEYELREQLGAGAQGAVYRAWDRQLECEVALKVLQPRLAETDRVGERMLREGRALAKVRHQNVVNVYAAEEHEGQIGLCMEFIRGRTLEALVHAQGPFSAAEAVTVGSKVGHALAAVHAAGLVHRDIKARNVMREEGGRIVLMDFGTGRDRGQLAGAGGGDLAGTPLYMAPEVLAGAPASQQSDIYGVGVLLYYLVSGHYPVEGRTLDEIVQAHVRGRRKPLAERRPDLPDEFIRIVDRAIAPDPDARHDTAALLVHDLLSIDVEEASRVLPPRTVTQRVLLGAAWATMTAIGLALLGFVTSMAFNVALERVAVSGETPMSWLIWGLRALVGPISYLAQLVIGALLVVALWRIARRLLPPFNRLAERLGVKAARLSRRIGFSDVDAFGQMIFVATLIYFVIVMATHTALISAMWTTVSNMTPAQRFKLSPGNQVEYPLVSLVARHPGVPGRHRRVPARTDAAAAADSRQRRRPDGSRRDPRTGDDHVDRAVSAHRPVRDAKGPVERTALLQSRARCREHARLLP